MSQSISSQASDIVLRKKTITITLDEFIVLALGHERRGTRAVSRTTGLILDTLLQGSTSYKVQFNSFEDDETPLDEPILWSFTEWYTELERVKKLKRDSINREIKRHIITCNLRLITKTLVHELCLDETYAKATAFHLMRKHKYKQISSFGIKLFAEEKDITPDIEQSKIDVRVESGALMGIEVIK